MSARTVLISGAGIAGSALAHWLLQCGFTPVIVERADSFREGGYIMDFWGVGFDAAERMNLISDLRDRSYHPTEVKLLDNQSRRTGGFCTEIFKKQLGDRFFSILRGDMAAVIYAKIKNSVEVIFGDSIDSIEANADGAYVRFERGRPRQFDLVIGADGLHSRVRKLMMPSNAVPYKYLGYYCAAFSTEGYEPRDEGSYVSYSAPGQMIARYALRNNKTVFFFTFASKHEMQYDHRDRQGAQRILTEKYSQSPWIEVPAILRAMRTSDDLYFDAVSQIRLEQWHKGPIALVGDAAYCPSLLAGQGSAFALAGAYVLAEELKNAGGDFSAAFDQYQSVLQGFVQKKQLAAENFGGWFAPSSWLAIKFRDKMTQLFGLPIVGRKIISRALEDKLNLPRYSD
ncbi:MAG TPA: FAD-dependent monooxygenase [Planktothrix sp.]|jgi:2-polyprenyl-6-methoxyphenol hydroxylase-like FAD-dependent oxidoreductase